MSVRNFVLFIIFCTVAFSLLGNRGSKYFNLKPKEPLACKGKNTFVFYENRHINLSDNFIKGEEGYQNYVANSSPNQVIYNAKLEDKNIANEAIANIDISDLHWMPVPDKVWTYDEKSGCQMVNVLNPDERQVLFTQQDLKNIGFNGDVEDLIWTNDVSKVLIYTNSVQVWRAKTKGDYWLYDLTTKKGRKLGKNLKASSLQFAKWSPDHKKVAYVSENNLYVEDVLTGSISKLTNDGSKNIINGTFDWAYEEELGMRDGFRWSEDSKNIAFWRFDATDVKKHILINNTDSLYPFIKEIEYPKAGYKPSPVKIGTVNINSKKINWIGFPEHKEGYYLPRMEWVSPSQLMIVHLNRLQNEANFHLADVVKGSTQVIHNEKMDNGWIAPFNVLDWDLSWWWWNKDKTYFLRTIEKDGWMRIVKVAMTGQKMEVLTKENFDANLLAFDKENEIAYFEASPLDATQRYLYRLDINRNKVERLTPDEFDGTNNYIFSNDAKYAFHTHGNLKTKFNSRLISLKNHEKILPVSDVVKESFKPKFNLEKFKLMTVDGIDIDGIMAKPLNFDATKKYPVVFFTYGEPASAVANDIPYFNEFLAALVPDGYIGIAMDNRGTPVLKGTDYRMAIYKRLGVVNARDQAMAAKEVLKWPFIDSSRVAVHGWSGGGNMTLNLMFKYPEIYKVGVAVSSITDQRFYDNIYMERFMGLPQYNAEEYKISSPANHAHLLKGKLLYMHGTGDDNVHYKNAEHLINELVKHGKLFELMVYPNRTHGIYEGSGTSKHVKNTIVDFIKRRLGESSK